MADQVNRMSDLVVVLRLIDSLVDHSMEEMVGWEADDMSDDDWDDLVARIYYIAEWADGRR
jgi:hypothetical protein